MKILFLHTNAPDYLVSGLFHGMRSVLGSDCVDLPRYDCMYKPYTEGMRSKLRGNGFTLYGLLDDIPSLAEERFFIWFTGIKKYDLYVIADIWLMWDTYKQLIKYVPPEKIIVLDTIDTSRIFPFNNYLSELKKNPLKLFASIHPKTKYFKRELGETFENHFGFSNKLLPLASIKKRLPKIIYPISFSIPQSKITRVSAESKSQIFASSIVDLEVQKNIAGSVFTALGKAEYKFNNEQDYYKDIQSSRFGITTKRAGWDCLRHYEYSANGAVLCFKDLDKKPESNAPHGLNRSNCIIYTSYSDLMTQISNVSDSEYEGLLGNTYKWAMENSTEALAKRVINTASHQRFMY